MEKEFTLGEVDKLMKATLLMVRNKATAHKYFEMEIST